ncbi:MAG: hypothetical protein EAZ30_10995 [Betaproteobacteria bacterium]|nr:MAG: hypothetical protein EAZ30_10995 [Betaproteobacteria bacterium]
MHERPPRQWLIVEGYLVSDVFEGWKTPSSFSAEAHACISIPQNAKQTMADRIFLYTFKKAQKSIETQCSLGVNE